MNFKERVKRDCDIFIDPRYFGEEHVIEGKTVIITPDSDRLIERQGGAEAGVADSVLLFYAKVEVLPPRKAPGSALNMDGREYTVDSWSVTDGMAQVALSQPRGI